MVGAGPTRPAVQAGTAIRFPNSDDIRHSVFSFSPAKTFTLKLYSGIPAEPVLFDKSGLVTDVRFIYTDVSWQGATGGPGGLDIPLKAGEQIVVNGLQRVRPGVEVAPQVVPMDAKGELQAQNQKKAGERS